MIPLNPTYWLFNLILITCWPPRRSWHSSSSVSSNYHWLRNSNSMLAPQNVTASAKMFTVQMLKNTISHFHHCLMSLQQILWRWWWKETPDPLTCSQSGCRSQKCNQWGDLSVLEENLPNVQPTLNGLDYCQNVKNRFPDGLHKFTLNHCILSTSSVVYS